jgi:flagellar basal-body rod modification protein FlgD
MGEPGKPEMRQEARGKMASVSGVLQQHQGTSQALAAVGATPMATTGSSSTSGKSSSSSTTSASATITSNDFLTLLVTELKNQDPTSDTDPNEYVNQLCEVNSLEQLVSINSTLTSAFGSSTSSSGTTTGGTTAKSGASAQTTTSNSTTAQAQAAYHANSLASQSAASSANSGGSAVSSIAAKLAPGNLSVPNANPAALRVGQSLSGLNQLQ